MADVGEAQSLLNQVRAFDMNSLPRSEELGKAFNFSETVEPARKIQSLFNSIPVETISDLSSASLGNLRNHLVNFLNLLEKVRTFNAEDGTDERLAIITQFPSAYNAAFDSLHPLVAYLSAKNSDLEKLEKDAKDVAANLSAQAEIILETLTDKKTEAENALSEIRKVAGEQGISLQAKFFKIEADQHEIDSRKWQNYTVYTAVGLIIYAICALVFSICYSPADQYQSIQIGISKVLIFAVISYMLILCSRTLMAHRHNFIVNRHRENALLTFTALAEAANSDDRRDIVLTHAAACIFDQQDTGYTKSGQNSVMPTTNIIEAIPRITQA